MAVTPEESICAMAHSLRTPLTSLKMILDVVSEQKLGELNERQLELINVARGDCDRISEAVTKHVDAVKKGDQIG